MPPVTSGIQLWKFEPSLQHQLARGGCQSEAFLQVFVSGLLVPTARARESRCRVAHKRPGVIPPDVPVAVRTVLIHTLPGVIAG